MSPTPDRRLLAVLDPRQIVRWMYVSRVSLAWAILIAAIAAAAWMGEVDLIKLADNFWRFPS